MPAESRQILGADKAYDTREFVETVLVQNTGKPGGWTIDARTTRHEGQAPTLKIRKLIETRIRLDEGHWPAGCAR